MDKIVSVINELEFFLLLIFAWWIATLNGFENHYIWLFLYVKKTMIEMSVWFSLFV